MLDLADGATRRRRQSLTPMIDVVFLLLVFFMLAARFGLDQVIEIRPPDRTSAAGAGYSGAPRLVEVGPAGLLLNGSGVTAEMLAPALRALMPDDGAVVILRGQDGANVQDIVDALDLLHGEGIENTVIVE